jgi:CRISPR associated protein Cas1
VLVSALFVAVAPSLLVISAIEVKRSSKRKRLLAPLLIKELIKAAVWLWQELHDAPHTVASLRAVRPADRGALTGRLLLARLPQLRPPGTRRAGQRPTDRRPRETTAAHNPAPERSSREPGLDGGAVLMAARQSSRSANSIHYEPAPPRTSRRPGVCLVEGYGVSVAVRHGRLVVRDGLPGERRERIIPRVQRGFGRLVMLGHAGTVTLEALRWLTDIGISLTQIDRDGRLIATSTAAPGDARLRRAQALAVATPAGLAVSSWLLEQKLAGQQQLLAELTDDPHTH